MTGDNRLSELLLIWEESREQGRPVGAEELCQDCPELLPTLQQQIRALEALNPVLDTTEVGAASWIIPKKIPARAAMSPETAGGALAPALRYRQGSLHAGGGLGEVFTAHDEEVHREVALKRIRKEFADDPECRRRFLVEAEVTGQLEHPGIVPVYGLGTSGDGRPFYAMRFIRGETLQEAIRRFHEPASPAPAPGERSLAFRQLLGRFVAICNTVGYAHSRGILHRDLKPVNVMLGPYGETLVLDWGLAKPFVRADEHRSGGEKTLVPRSGSDASSTQGTIGTPAYMSPEQAKGAWDIVGPASDIYSLGAILYALLTGQAPFQGRSTQEVLDRAQRGQFAPLRQLKHDVPRPLEAIWLKAMAFRPQDRYPTALALAADVEQWLADEPVGAWREPWAVRARRWLSRHRTLVSAGAAAAVVAVVLLTVLSATLAAAKQRESQATQLARQRQVEAEENFLLATDAVDKYFTTVSTDQLLKEPGQQRLRKELLKLAVEFHEKIVALKQDEPRMQAAHGKALNRLALIYVELDPAKVPRQTSPTELVLQALAIFDRLARAYPDNPSYQYELGQTYLHLGRVYWDAQGTKKAGDAYQESQAIFRKLNAKKPNTPEIEWGLAKACTAVGVYYRDTSEPDKARLAFQEALALLKELVEAHPHETNYKHSLANTHRSLAFLHMLSAQFKDAAAFHEAARALWEELAAANPRITAYRLGVAVCSAELAGDYMALGKTTKAWVEIEKARKAATLLVKENPDHPDYPRMLVGVNITRATIHTVAGRLAEAEKVFVDTEQSVKELALNGGKGFEPGLLLGEIYANRGIFLSTTGKPQEALVYYDRAIEEAERARQHEQHLTLAKFYLGNGSWLRAMALGRLGRHADAVKDWEQAIKFDPFGVPDLLKLSLAAALSRHSGIPLGPADLGDHARATSQANEVLKKTAIPGPTLHHLATVFTVSARAAGQDPKLSQADRERLAEQYASRAVELLRKAAELGYFKAAANVDFFETDPDLEPLRSRPDFQRLLSELERAKSGEPKDK
jgi:serine/threonine-protein kinase